jgi:MATE family multidrug resistance protein
MVLCDFWIAFHSEDLYKDMWLPWARSSLEGLGTFFEYGLPCAVIECSHWWVLELLIFLAGYISVEDFQAQTVVINMYGLIFMVPLGLSYTVSSLVGTNLAQGKYH